MKIHIVDFLFDYLGGPQEGDVLCGVSAYYSFHTDNIDDIPAEYYIPEFNIYAGTPGGIKRHLNNLLKTNCLSNMFFFDSIIVMEEFDESKVMARIKSYFQTLEGKTEKELIIKAKQYFSWSDDEIDLEFDDQYDYLLH